MDKKKVIKYIIITYVIAWTVQSAGSIYSLNHPDMKGNMVFSSSLVITMFIPLIAALIVKADFKGMGWKPRFKGNIKWLIFAVFSFVPVTAIGAALFFALFPDLFDMSGSYLRETYLVYGIDFIQQLEEKGMSFNMYLVVMIFASIFEGPFINMFFAIGEEVGWRGFLYPELTKRFGRVKGWIIGGIIWAAFHFPCIIIAGYEYGLEYIGAPWLGLIAFTLSCIVLGIIHEIIYDETKCIWYPALLHGAVNSISGIPMGFINGNEMEKISKYQILGPYVNGLMGMIPMILLAVVMAVIILRKNKKVQ